MRKLSGTNPCGSAVLAIHVMNLCWRAGSAQVTVEAGAEQAADGTMGEDEGWLMDNPILQTPLLSWSDKDRHPLSPLHPICGLPFRLSVLV
jgi:hypothetical protein